jgi:hypothetical protein
MSDAEPGRETAAQVNDEGDGVGWDQSWEFENGGVPFGEDPEPGPQGESEARELTLRQKIVAALMSNDPEPSSNAADSTPVKRVRATPIKQKAGIKGKVKGKKPAKVVKGKKVVKKR